VKVVECCSEPDVPAAVMVYVPAGVPGRGGGGVLALPPAQPATCIARSTSSPASGMHAARRRYLGVRAARPAAIKASAKIIVHGTGSSGGFSRLVGTAGTPDAAVVEIVSVELIGLAPGVNVLGENEQEVRVGRPEQLSVIAFSNDPNCGVAVNV